MHSRFSKYRRLMSLRPRARVVSIMTIAAVIVGLTPRAALAWKPYTHNHTGSQVQADLRDGKVTINGREYAVDGRVNRAINTWPAYYNAGVVGPDGFPDIAYGQAAIHPGDPASTGAWLGYILQQAWTAQADASGYTGDEKGQILAFAYGFLTHAAGDTLAHTLMNDYAGGVFPSVKEVITRLPAAKIALRHLVPEGYSGAATAGFDAQDSDEVELGESCANATIDNGDTVCNPGTDHESRVEVSNVCADNAAPNDATTCTTEGPGGTDVADYSADATPGIGFAAPTRWLQNTMVSLDAHTPADDCDHDGDGDHGCPNGQYAPGAADQLTRGPVLDVVLDQEAKLQIYAAKVRFDADHTMCSTTLDGGCHDITRTLTVPTVRGFAHVGVEDTRCTADHFCVASPGDLADDLVHGLIASYAEAWIEDIDAMRDHWIEFSTAVTKGLFDPQTRRDAANEKCTFGAVGPEALTNIARNECEAGVGAVDSVIYALEHAVPASENRNPSWIDDYLLPAAGAPDFVGDINGFLSSVGDAIDDLFTFVGISNPLAQISADVDAFIEDKVNEWVEEQYGVNPEALSQFEKSPNQWMCGSDENNPAKLTLPLPETSGGPVTLTPSGLFTPEEHASLDQLMGLPADHHEEGAGVPEDCGPLNDAAKLNPNTFAPLNNTVTLGKLLLLDGNGLNSVLGNTLEANGVIKSDSAVKTYATSNSAGFPANVMVDGLDAMGRAAHTEFGALSTSLPWLHLIDGDHAWRADRLPRYCRQTSGFSDSCDADIAQSLAGHEVQPTPANPDGLQGQINGGNGNMPMFESCLLRPAFRTLFTDWENGPQNFPDLGDEMRPDASVPNAPAGTLTFGTGTFTSGGTTYVGPANKLTLSATDAVFTDANIALRYRIYRNGTAAGGWTDISKGGELHVPTDGGDGAYTIDYQTQDPCHTFDAHDALTTPTISTTVVVDTTGPAITITSPAPEGTVFDITGTSTISYTVTDAASGLKIEGVTLDGPLSSNGAALDMFHLYPGTHTIVVSAKDNLDNPSRATRTFTVQATSAGLLSSWSRASSLGLVPGTGAYNGGRAKLQAALAAHHRGQHATEGNQLGAFVNQIQAQRGRGIDAATADRFIAWAQDLINRQA
jgi:hypothetical protein